MPTHDQRGLEILSRDECVRLLRAGGVGRLAWFDGRRPIVRPVNFAMDGDRLVIRTGEGTIFRAAQLALAATFEVDQTSNVDHTAWSVIVDGTIGRAEDDAARALPLRSWAPEARDHFVELRIEEMSGRRIGDRR